MLKIQEFISCFDDVTDAIVYLKRNLNIETDAHILLGEGDEYDVALFKPGQKADMTNPLVREANCLVLDEKGELLAKAWNHPYVAREANQFPNVFDLRGAICEEVIDGETIVVYNVEGSWFIAPVLDHEAGIKQRLGQGFSDWDKPFQNMNPSLCFIFSFVSPYTKNIMPILNQELYLTGVINLENNIEMSNGMLDNIAIKMDIARPNWNEIYGNSSLTQRLLNMRTLAPGLMLRDKNDNRVFVPNPIHHAVKCAKEAGNITRPTHIAKILQTCRDKADVASITAAYDAYGPMLELLQSARLELIEEVLILWNVAKNSISVVDFAQAIQHHPLRHLLFMYKHNRSMDIVEEIKTLKPIKLIRLTKNKYEKEYKSASQQLKFAGGTDGNSKIKEEDWGDED